MIGLLVATAPPARAEFDWPVTLAVPDMDVAFGVTGGVAFGEDARARQLGALVGVDASLLTGVFGLHVGLQGHPEGFSTRLGATVEATVWYLVMVGVGARFGALVGDGGPGIPDTTVALTVFVGIPIPLVRLCDGERGTLVLMPYARPGLRVAAVDDLSGFHEAGLMLKWTSFGF